MATFDFEELARPISDANPCGPDLELTENPDYMQFMARAEGLIPASYFSFDRSTVDFEAEFQSIKKLLAETRDVRVLVLLAKLLILNQDLRGFSGCCAALAALLAGLWEHVHPRIESSDAMMRMAVLQSLDDGPAVVLPLQHAPLVQSRRYGPISYRNYLLATGEVKPREGEEALGLQTLEGILLEAELRDITAPRDDLQKLQAALSVIQTTTAQHVGFEESARFDKLPPLVQKMVTFVDSIVLKKDPSAVTAAPSQDTDEPPSAPGRVRSFLEGMVAKRATPASAAAGGPPPVAEPGAIVIASAADAAAGLSGAAAYFSRCEPSNPAVLLVRQAEQLMGRSFLEVMRILIPAHAEQATIHIGTEQVFELPVERLSALATGTELNGSGEPVTSDGGANGAADARFVANTRSEAMTLLYYVGEYYRAVEPSSPIPLLTERALTLAEQDFLGLLKDVLPDAAKPGKPGSGN